MVNEFQERVDLTPKVWTKEPTSLLTELGEEVGFINIIHENKLVELPNEVKELVATLKSKAQESENFFDGQLTHVSQVTRTGSVFELRTQKTKFFDYLAAGHYYGERQGSQKANPIRPLAIQSVLLTEDGRFLFERKSKSSVEFPGAYHLFGGALKPDQTDPEAAMQSIMKRKWQVNLGADQIQTSGLELDTVNNIVHIFYLIRLGDLQFKTIQHQYIRKDQGGRRIKKEVLHYPPLTPKNIERLLEHQPLTRWNPAAFDDLICGLAASGLINVDKVKQLRKENVERLALTPFEYKHPYTKYL